MKTKLFQKITCKNKSATYCLRIVFLLAAFFLAACAQEAPDYDLYENMRDYALQKFQESGAVMRDDLPDKFKSEYIIDLSGIIKLVFGSPQQTTLTQQRFRK